MLLKGVRGINKTRKYATFLKLTEKIGMNLRLEFILIKRMTKLYKGQNYLEPY